MKKNCSTKPTVFEKRKRRIALPDLLGTKNKKYLVYQTFSTAKNAEELLSKNDKELLYQTSS